MTSTQSHLGSGGRWVLEGAVLWSPQALKGAPWGAEGTVGGSKAAHTKWPWPPSFPLSSGSWWEGAGSDVQPAISVRVRRGLGQSQKHCQGSGTPLLSSPPRLSSGCSSVGFLRTPLASAYSSRCLNLCSGGFQPSSRPQIGLQVPFCLIPSAVPSRTRYQPGPNNLC